MPLVFVGWGLCLIASLGRGIGWLWPEITTAVLAGGLLSIAAAAFLMLYKGEWNPLRLIPSFTVLWYGAPMAYIDYVDPIAYSRMGIGQAWGIFSTVLLLSASAFALSFFFRTPHVGPYKGNLGELTMLRLWVLGASVAQALMIASGAWTYGVMYGVDGSEPELAVVMAAFFLRPTAILLAVAAGRELALKILKPQAALIYLACFAVQLVWLTIDGRRIFAVIAIIALAMLLRTLYEGRRLRLAQIAKASILGMILAVAMSWGWQVFFLLREQSNRDSTGYSIVEMLAAADTLNASATLNRYNANLTSRPYLLTESVAVSQTTATGHLLGGGILNAAGMAIPGIMWPDKRSIVAPTTEVLWASQLGIPIGDWSNTLLLEGILDLSWPGFALYVLAAYYLTRTGMAAVRQVGSVNIVLFAGCSMLIVVLSIEQAASEYFVWLRNILLLATAVGVGRLLSHRPMLTSWGVPGLARKHEIT